MTSVHSVPHADLALEFLNRIEMFFVLSMFQAILLLIAKPSQTLLNCFPQLSFSFIQTSEVRDNLLLLVRIR